MLELRIYHLLRPLRLRQKEKTLRHTHRLLHGLKPLPLHRLECSLSLLRCRCFPRLLLRYLSLPLQPCLMKRFLLIRIILPHRRRRHLQLIQNRQPRHQKQSKL